MTPSTASGAREESLTGSPVRETGQRKMPGLSAAAEVQTWRLLVLVAAMAVMWVVFNFETSGVFFTPRNLSNLTVQTAITALVALGSTWVLVVRQIDLSCGSLLSLTGVIVVKMQVSAGWTIVEAIAFTLALGIAIGALSGFLIVRFQIPSFIMTLAGLLYLSGASFIISKGFVLTGTGGSFYKLANDSFSHAVTVGLAIVLAIGAAVWLFIEVKRRRDWAAAHGERFTVRLVTAIAFITSVIAFGVVVWTYTSFGGLPYIIAVLGAAAVMMWVVGGNTVFGRHMYAIGGNPEAARRAGISVGRVIVIVFVVAAFLAALGGILQASRLDAASPDVGSLVTLNAISAAVLGGTSLLGGRGSIFGTLLGALILGTILNGLSLMNVNTYYQYVAIGWILVVAVGFDAAAQRRLAHE